MSEAPHGNSAAVYPGTIPRSPYSRWKVRILVPASLAARSPTNLMLPCKLPGSSWARLSEGKMYKECLWPRFSLVLLPRCCKQTIWHLEIIDLFCVCGKKLRGPQGQRWHLWDWQTCPSPAFLLTWRRLKCLPCFHPFSYLHLHPLEWDLPAINRKPKNNSDLCKIEAYFSFMEKISGGEWSWMMGRF